MSSVGFDDRPALLPDLIAQHGRWRSGRTALVCGERRLDWESFATRCFRVGQALLAAGLGPGSRAGVLMSNGSEMVEVLFGAGFAGVSVAPLNVSISDSAVAGMLRDCGARVVFATADQAARIDALRAAGDIPDVRLQVCVEPPSSCWQDYEAWIGAAPPVRPDTRLAPETECNIIYSSGTTGVPKGIMHSHRCRRNWADDMALALRYRSDAVTLCSLGLYSNISWAAMLATILLGGTLVIMPRFTPAALLDHVARHRVTHGAFVPVQFQRLLEEPHVDAADFSSLRAVMCCGSPLAPALKQRAQALLGCDFIELYGLTEGVITTLAPEDFGRKLASVGKPIPGQELLLLDAMDRPVPAGEAGEIVGRGRLVMQGYHAQPEATLEATWVAPDGSRWLRTGDIGRLDEEGFLYLVDRKKDLILSGGQNIYPSDIEAVMREHPSVREVAVIGVPSDRWGETPCAVVALAPGTPGFDAPDALARGLLAWTNDRVGRQQRISEVIFVDGLPRNPNGKVLKRELRRQYALHHG